MVTTRRYDRAACVQGKLSTAAEVTKDLAVAANTAAVLRMKHYTLRAEKIKSFDVSSLIEGAIRTFDPSAPSLG